jgi:hypothetical protein
MAFGTLSNSVSIKLTDVTHAQTIIQRAMSVAYQPAKMKKTTRAERLAHMVFSISQSIDRGV